MIAKGDQAQLSVLGAIHGEPKMNHRNTGGPSKLYQIKVKGRSIYGKDIICITLVKGKKYKKTKSVSG